MGLQGLTVTLTTTLATAAIAGTTDYHGSIRVILKNRGSSSIYLSNSTASTGSYLMTTADAALTVDLMIGESLYAMSTGAAAVIDVLRMNGTTGN